MITLGDEVKDSVTGFTGIAVARVEWLHGCTRYVVQPEGLKDGKPYENQSFDDPQLQIVTPGKVKLAPKQPTGGPMPVPQARQHVQ